MIALKPIKLGEKLRDKNVKGMLETEMNPAAKLLARKKPDKNLNTSFQFIARSRNNTKIAASC